MNCTAGYSTTTYKLKLHCKHPDWIARTKALYNDVAAFYCRILADDTAALSLSNQNLLRRLETITIVGRDKLQAPMPLPFEKVPLYFRRSAINTAIGFVRSHTARVQAWEKARDEAESAGLAWKKRCPSWPMYFNFSPVLYQGMYKEFGQGSILIKLWSGSSWAWVRHSYSGRAIASGLRHQSPTLVVHRKTVMLHVPIVAAVDDIRTAGERVADGERYCAVSFTASDVLATCVIFSGDGHAEDSYFIRGGNEFVYRRKRLLNIIKKNRRLTGHTPLRKGENTQNWTRLCNQTEHYAHLVSKRIVDYCVKNQVKLIVIAKPEDLPGKKVLLNNRDMAYFIGRRIADYTGYKAWKVGIALTTVRPRCTVIKCHECGAYLKRYNEGHAAITNDMSGRLYRCPNGHRGNSALNTAKNIGLMFYEKFEFARGAKAG